MESKNASNMMEIENEEYEMNQQISMIKHNSSENDIENNDNRIENYQCKAPLVSCSSSSSSSSSSLQQLPPLQSSTPSSSLKIENQHTDFHHHHHQQQVHSDENYNVKSTHCEINQRCSDAHDIVQNNCKNDKQRYDGNHIKKGGIFAWEPQFHDQDLQHLRMDFVDLDTVKENDKFQRTFSIPFIVRKSNHVTSKNVHHDGKLKKYMFSFDVQKVDAIREGLFQLKMHKKNGSKWDPNHVVAGAEKNERIYYSIEPRNYQKEILEECKKQNIIAVAPTGAGKTYIAALLAQDLLRKNKKKQVLFIVNQIVLVSQQSKELKKIISEEFNVGTLYSGDSRKHQMWRKQPEFNIWKEMKKRMHAIVLTAQLLLNSLRSGHVQIDDFQLLIFDECHHAKNMHPFRLIMKEFYEPKKISLETKLEDAAYSKDDILPKIFGLTASPAAKNSVGETLLHLIQLGQNLDCKVRRITKYEHELRDVVVLPNIQQIEVEMDQASSNFRDLILIVMKEIKNNMLNMITSQGSYSEEDVHDLQNQNFNTEQFKSWISSILSVYGLEEQEDQDDEEIEDEDEDEDDDENDNNDNGEEKDMKDKENPQFSQKHIEDDQMCKELPGSMAIQDYLASGDVLMKFIDITKTLQKKELTKDQNILVLAQALKVLNESLLINDHRSSKAAWTYILKFLKVVEELPIKNIFIQHNLTKSTFDVEKLPAITQKHYKLLDLLAQKCNLSDFKVLIFVKTRMAAIELSDLLTKINNHSVFVDSTENLTSQLSGKLRVGQLLGHKQSNNVHGMSGSKQRKVVKDFENGNINILIATSVAEEGLDISSCRIVIRFHVAESALQLIQSRGRARNKDSEFYCIYHSNQKENRKIEQSILQEKKMLKAIDMISRIEENVTDLNLYNHHSANGSAAVTLSHIWEFIWNYSRHDLTDNEYTELMFKNHCSKKIDILKYTCRKLLNTNPEYIIYKKGRQNNPNYFGTVVIRFGKKKKMTFTAQEDAKSIKDAKYKAASYALLQLKKRDLIVYPQQSWIDTFESKLNNSTLGDQKESQNSQLQLAPKRKKRRKNLVPIYANNSHQYLSLDTSLNILQHHCISKYKQQPTYKEIMFQSNAESQNQPKSNNLFSYKAIVSLPDGSQSIVSEKPHKTKKDAKREAALAMCNWILSRNEPLEATENFLRTLSSTATQK